MSRTKRMGVLLFVAAALPLITAGAAMAGGGSAPPPPGLVFTPSREITATLVIDPHGSLTNFFATTHTSTGQIGSIVLSRKHYADASAVFQIGPFTTTFYPWALGCDLSQTNVRFVNTNGIAGNYAPLENFIPSAVLTTLFSQIGVTISAAVDPGIAAVDVQSCSPVAGPDGSQTGPGILLLETKIGFWALSGTPVPK